MRYVIAKDTGEKIPMHEAYKVPMATMPSDKDKGRKNEYYSSEEAYKRFDKQRKYRTKCIDVILGYLGYTSGLKPPTIIFKKLKELENYGYDVVYLTLLKEKESIEYALRTKSFPVESSRIFYMMAIVVNNIKPIYDEVKKKENFKEKLKEEVPVVEEIVSTRRSSKKTVGRFLDELQTTS